MSENSLKEIKLKIFDVNSFRYPKYSIINNIKIANLKISSRIIAKNKILVYGNYDVVITYNNIIYNHYTTKNLVKYKKASFHKILHYDIYKFSLRDDLKTKVKLLSKPLPIYSLRKFPCNFFWDYSLCQITLFLSISVNLFKSSPNSECANINFDNSKDINNTVLPSDNKLLVEDKATDKNKLSIPAVEESSDFNIINNDTFISEPLPSIIHERTISKPAKKTLIEGNVILGRGNSEIFLEKTISLSEPIKPIWKITKVMSTADIAKIDIRGEKAFASGFAFIDINYKTLVSADTDTVRGNIQYLHLAIPFSLCIDLIPDCRDKIKNSDNCKVNSIYVSESHILSKPSTIDNETVYNEFKGQFVVQVTVLVTRNMELYI